MADPPVVEQPDPIPAGHCRIARPPELSEAARRYPLATRTGAELLAVVIAAQSVWRRMTELQRAVVVEAYFATLNAGSEGDVVPMPALPDWTSTATRRALERRGLVAGDRLTPAALQVAQWRPLPAGDRPGPDPPTDGDPQSP